MPPSIAAAGRGNLPVLQAVLDTGKVKQDALDAALFAAPESQKEMREALDEGRREAAASRAPRRTARRGRRWPAATRARTAAALKVEVQDAGLVTSSGVIAHRVQADRPGHLRPARQRARARSRSSGRATRSRGSSRGGSRRRPCTTRQGSKPVAEGRRLRRRTSAAARPSCRRTGRSSAASTRPASPTGRTRRSPGTSRTERTSGGRRRSPGSGHSCPVVWGDRVFLTTAVGGNTDAPHRQLRRPEFGEGRQQAHVPGALPRPASRARSSGRRPRSRACRRSSGT